MNGCSGIRGSRAFTYQLLQLNNDRYPKREFTRQTNESDAAFLRRLWKRSGIAWFFRPAVAHGNDDDTPRHELVLFDDPMQLPESAAGEIRYHRLDGTEQRDSITLWAPAVQLVTGSTARSSYDYKVSNISQVEEASEIDQGDTGNEFAALLQDAVVEMPHAGDSHADHHRLTRLRTLRHEFEAACTHGVGGCREQAVGEWFSLTGHAELDANSPEERQYVTIKLHHQGNNNLPKELNERAQALFAACERHVTGWVGCGSVQQANPTDQQPRYLNRFICMQRGTPLVPAWNPRADLPPTPPTTAIVVGPPGEEVWCDEHGRVKIRFPGLDPRDHEHAQGAGASGTDADSAWVRWLTLWAGDRYGIDAIPRVGMEVKIEFADGDPDRPYIAGVLHAAATPPVDFSHSGHLPGNKYLTGIKSKEVHGVRYGGQLRIDDTPGQISVQLASEHAYSQLNLGDVRTDRQDGHAQPRGEGGELRSNGPIALRGHQGVHITAETSPHSRGRVLDRQILLGVADVLQSIHQQLGQLSSTHHAGSTEGDKLAQLIRQLKDWENGTTTAPDAAGGGAPMVAITGPAGVGIASGDNLMLGAQTHIDAVSAAHTQITAGQQLLLRCGQLFSAFARGAMKLIARDKLELQAHQGNIELTASDDLVLTARRRIVIQAPEVQVIGQGAATQWGAGSIVEQASGSFVVKSAGFAQSSGGDGLPEQVTLPGSGLKTDEKYVLRLRGGGTPAHRRYRIELDDGRVSEGVSDAQGRTQLAQADALRIASVVLLDD